MILTLCAATLAAQPNPFRWQRMPLQGGGHLDYRLELPDKASPSKPIPFLVLLVGGKQDRAAVYDEMAGRWWQPALSRGWILLAPVGPAGKRFDAANISSLDRMFQSLRTRSTFRGNRIHLASVGDGFESAVEVMGRFGFEFASLTVIEPAQVSQDVLRKLPRMVGTSVSVLSKGEGDAPSGFSRDLLTRLKAAGVQAKWSQMSTFDTELVWKNLGEESKKLDRPETPAGEAHKLLDAWHTAAAKAQGEVYFGSFTEDAVFMGTDATERWDLKSFRAWAAPHFKQKPAWTFVPTRRNLTVSPGGEVAWFDEVLGSAAYGQCRGSGVLHRVGGDWKIAHYILSLPVPNDLIDRVVGGTRSWRRAVEAGHSVEAALLPRTVYIVRHAEKVLSGKDPELTPAGHSRAAALARMLPSKGLDHVFATEFKRTRQTVEPAAKIAGQSVKVVSAGDPAGLVRRLMAMESGATALVAGHSNTIGPILVALGLKGKVTITEQQHDDLFVVSLDHAGVPSLQHLQHRVTPPGAGKK